MGFADWQAQNQMAKTGGGVGTTYTRPDLGGPSSISALPALPAVPVNNNNTYFQGNSTTLLTNYLQDNKSIAGINFGPRRNMASFLSNSGNMTPPKDFGQSMFGLPKLTGTTQDQFAMNTQPLTNTNQDSWVRLSK